MRRRRRSLTVSFCVTLAALLATGCASLRASRPVSRELVLERQWARSTLMQEFLGFRRPHRMTPLSYNGLIIQGNAIDGIVAFDRKSGAEKWRRKIENGVEGGAALADGRLFFGASDGRVYSLAADTGKVLWSVPVQAEVLAPPTVAQGVVFVQNGADVVYALEAATGKQLWLYNRQATSNLSIRATTRPALDENTVYVGFSDGFLVALNRQSGAMLWDKKLSRNIRFKDIDATPVIDEATIYISSYDGSLYALNKSDGATLWQFEEGGYTPVTIAGDTLYYATTGGAVYALEKASGRKLWSVAVRNGIATQPILAQRYLVFGESEGALLVVDARTGSELARFASGRGLLAAPLIEAGSNEIFFISNNANLFALKLGFKTVDRLPWQSQQTL